jgi:hypothetical protein
MMRLAGVKTQREFIREFAKTLLTAEQQKTFKVGIVTITGVKPHTQRLSVSIYSRAARHESFFSMQQLKDGTFDYQALRKIVQSKICSFASTHRIKAKQRHTV